MIYLLNSIFSGGILPFVLMFSALYFIFYLKGLPFRSFGSMLSRLKEREKGSISPMKAVSMALAGTLGVGNIVGVSAALISGGPGVLFWIWISSFAAMIIKYAEIVLSLDKRVYKNGKTIGGAMYYMAKGAAILFVILTVFCSFTIGSSIQTAASANAVSYSMNIPPIAVSLLMGVAAALSIFKQKTGLFDFSVKLVPLMSILYSVLTITILFQNRNALPFVFSSIIQSAFGLKQSATGIFFGFFTSLRYGVVRGLLSNEAGCGTAPLAHVESNVKNSASQGALGVLEVCIDTLFFCTITGLAILSSAVPIEGNPIDPVLQTFQKGFGAWGNVLLSISIFFFAFATLICWSYYGSVSLNYLSSDKRLQNIYKFLFVLSASFGILLPENFLFELSDLAISMMALLNLFYLLKNKCYIKNAGIPFLKKKKSLSQK